MKAHARPFIPAAEDRQGFQVEEIYKHSIEILDAKQAWDSEKLFDEIHDPYEEVIG